MGYVYSALKVTGLFSAVLLAGYGCAYLGTHTAQAVSPKPVVLEARHLDMPALKLSTELAQP